MSSFSFFKLSRSFDDYCILNAEISFIRKSDVVTQPPLLKSSTERTAENFNDQVESSTRRKPDDYEDIEYNDEGSLKEDFIPSESAPDFFDECK